MAKRRQGSYLVNSADIRDIVYHNALQIGKSRDYSAYKEYVEEEGCDPDYDLDSKASKQISQAKSTSWDLPGCMKSSKPISRQRCEYYGKSPSLRTGTDTVSSDSLNFDGMMSMPKVFMTTPQVGKHIRTKKVNVSRSNKKSKTINPSVKVDKSKALNSCEKIDRLIKAWHSNPVGITEKAINKARRRITTIKLQAYFDKSLRENNISPLHSSPKPRKSQDTLFASPSLQTSSEAMTVASRGGKKPKYGYARDYFGRIQERDHYIEGKPVNRYSDSSSYDREDDNDSLYDAFE